MKRQMMILTDLSCPSCAAKVEQAAQKLPGMKSARVAFGAGTLNVEYDETQLTETQIGEVVRQFGPQVTTVLSSPSR